MQLEWVEKHIFSGISDYFRLFFTDALKPLIMLCSFSNEVQRMDTVEPRYKEVGYNKTLL